MRSLEQVNIRTNVRTYVRTFVLTYIRTGQTLYPRHNVVVRGDKKKNTVFFAFFFFFFFYLFSGWGRGELAKVFFF